MNQCFKLFENCKLEIENQKPWILDVEARLRFRLQNNTICFLKLEIEPRKLIKKPQIFLSEVNISDQF